MHNFYKSYYNRNNTGMPILDKKKCEPNLIPSRQKSSDKKKKAKKIDIKELKKNTCNSLCDVENFLCDFNSLIKYIKLYKFFKK